MLYKLEEKVIDKDDIILLVDEDIDDTVFELVSSILKNDCNKAMKLYYNFINNGMDVSQIIAIIASQIRLLFQVKRLYNSGKSNEEIAKILEFKSPYRVKYLLNDCYYYSEDDLIKYLSKLADIDKNIKSGNGDGKFLLELFIAKKICNFGYIPFLYLIGLFLFLHQCYYSKIIQIILLILLEDPHHVMLLIPQLNFLFLLYYLL